MLTMQFRDIKKQYQVLKSDIDKYNPQNEMFLKN